MDINYLKKYEPIEGKWYVTKELGRGAFGTVFEIERRDFINMKAALKVVSIPSTAGEVDSFREENYDMDEKSITSYFYGFVEEFQKEIQIMTALAGHSNIVGYMNDEVIEHKDEIGWDIFIRMELLTPMNKYFANNPPDELTVIRLGIDICKALEICQKYKIIHRDIKPSNIFISDTGDFKIGDFGVSKTLEKTSSALSKKGTYTYMAPEVFKGEKYGANVDIYSLGIVMYKLLNDNMEPFRTNKTYSDSEKALVRRMSGNSIPSPKRAGNTLSDIIIKACSFRPEDRYENPTVMKLELLKLYDELKTNNDKTDLRSNNNETELNKPLDIHQSKVYTDKTDENMNDSDSVDEPVSTCGNIDEDDVTLSVFGDSAILQSTELLQIQPEKKIPSKVENGAKPTQLAHTPKTTSQQKSCREVVSEISKTYKMRTFDENVQCKKTMPAEEDHGMASNRTIKHEKNYDLNELSKSYRMRSFDEAEDKQSDDLPKGVGERGFNLEEIRKDKREEKRIDLQSLSQNYKMRSLDEMDSDTVKSTDKNKYGDSPLNILSRSYKMKSFDD